MAHYNVIGPFLEFLKIFFIHVKFTTCWLFFMLDPRFKSLQFVESFARHGNTIYLATKYDEKEVIPLLMIIFD